MSKLLIGSIDLNKIDKTRIVTKNKSGEPFANGAKYINVAVWVNDTVDKYGHCASIQMGDKDNKIYIGNLKEWKKAGDVTPHDEAPKDDSDDLPF